jgi:hypothetical protein
LTTKLQHILALGFDDLLYRWRPAPNGKHISEKCCSHCRNIGRRCGEFHAGKRIRARASFVYLLFCRLVIHLRVFLSLPKGALGLCLGAVGLHHRYRRDSCGIGAEPSVQCNYEQSRKRRDWHSVHGCSKHDCFSGTRPSIFITLVQASDAELSKFLAACLSLESDYAGRNGALIKLAANAQSIENLRHGFAFEEIGAGFNRTNLRRFLLDCLEVASVASNLNIQLVAIRRLMDSGALPHLNRALRRAREVVIASFSSSSDRKNSIECELIDCELRELQSLTWVPKPGSEQVANATHKSACPVIGVTRCRTCVS